MVTSLFSKILGRYGFRNLAQFNIALLAKQGWNIITNPNCLLARVLKAKYFPESDFLHSRVGAHPSYTWKSIWCARGLLERGLGWRVGSGFSINIWSEAWIEGTDTDRVVSNEINPNFTLVSDLIDHSRFTWKVETILFLFSDDQANQILSMPLSSSNPDDAIIWRFDSSGCYSVKSGYRLLAHVSDSQIVVSTNSNVDQIKRLYSALWSLAIPTKIKEDSSGYKLHIVRSILSHLGIALFLPSLEHDWLLWLSSLFDQLDKRKMVLFVVSIWGIWTYRNNKIHNQMSQSAMDLVRFIKSYVGELTSIADNDASLCPASRMHWIPPLGDTIKVNFDACFSTRYRTSFSRVVARNNGGYMAAGTIPHLFVPSPEVAEAYACIDALMLARDVGFNSVIIEGDALTVINKANCREADRSVLRSLMKQIHSMRAFFASLMFSHVVRTCNEVAHLLAREGRDFPGPRFWVEEAALKDKRWVDFQN
ncbi:hypothetical protein GQ457_08G012070 [Hibiscus cannabinus]